MIKKNISFALILILLSFTLTGCYDAMGIEDFNYIVALGIDKSENNLIDLSIQIAITKSSSDSSSSQSSSSKIYHVECESIDSGINILNNYLNKKINLTHCSAIVFSEEIAKENIKSYVTALGNNVEIRPTCNIIISSERAYDVLDKVSNSGEDFSARLYEYILNSVDYTGYTIDASFSNFHAMTNNNQTQPTAIYAIIDKEKDTVQNAGTAIFKNDTMVGTITPSQTMAYLLLKNDLKSCIISIDSPFNKEETIDLDLKTYKPPKIDVNLINNTPLINVEIFLQGNISNSGPNFDYTTNNNIQIVSEATNQYLEKLIKDYLYTISKDYNSDISNFGTILSSKFETANELEKIHWNEIFKNSYFKVKVDTELTASNLFNKQ